jgi:hypothetical protein
MMILFTAYIQPNIPYDPANDWPRLLILSSASTELHSHNHHPVFVPADLHADRVQLWWFVHFIGHKRSMALTISFRTEWKLRMRFFYKHFHLKYKRYQVWPVAYPGNSCIVDIAIVVFRALYTCISHLQSRPSPLPPVWFLVLISVGGWVRAIVRLKGLGQLKNPMSSSGIEPATFRLVA